MWVEGKGKSPMKSRSPRKWKSPNQLKSSRGNIAGSCHGGLPVVGVRAAEFVYLLGDGEDGNPNNEVLNVTPGISTRDGNYVIETGIQVTPSKTCHRGSGEGTGEAVVTPRVGMVFCSSEEVEAFYKRYAQSQGFGVSRTQSAYTYTTHGKSKRGTTWRCEAWGGPDLKEQREIRKRERAMELGGSIVPEPVRTKKRKSKKCNCPAKLYAGVKNNGSWEIRNLVLDHKNHNPTPSKSRLVKEYRMQHFNRNVRRKLLNDYEVGVPISKIHGSMARERGGFENMEITDKDMRHVVDEVRKSKMDGGDANALVAYFERMQEDNKNFFHAHRLDNEGRLKDVIWIDTRSQAAFEDFGDVVCFDCTYLTNEYELAFGNFVGVNHHGQSLLLGCALLSHEDKDTFTWVFRQWLIGMGGKPPEAILTDQAAAMRAPLEEVMPETRHRWCIWHILMKVPNKLGVHERFDELNEELMNTIYDSLTIGEFQMNWLGVMRKFELESNEWLRGLYEERSMWVPAYMKDYFWAGMRTTQRVESINSFFDQFVSRRTRLCEFGERYCAALEKRIKQEKDADARGVKWYRRTVTGFPLEKFFHGIYTDAKFRQVQRECERLMYCYSREEKEVGPNQYEYLIEDRVWITLKGGVDEVLTEKRRMYHVSFNSESKEVSCMCKKFITDGILCRHSIRVLDQNLVTQIPDRYVLRRWRKDVPRKHTRVKVAYEDPTKTESVMRYDEIMLEVEAISSEASLSKKKTAMLLKGLKILKDQLEKVEIEKDNEDAGQVTNQPGGGATSESSLGAGMIGLIDMVCTPTSERASQSSEGTNIKDPKLPKRKGRKRTTRYKSPGEKGWKKANASIANDGEAENSKGKKGKGGMGKSASTMAGGTGAPSEEKAVADKPKSNRKATPSDAKSKATTSGANGKKRVGAKMLVEEARSGALAKLPVKRRQRGSGLEETAAAMYFVSITNPGEDVLLAQNEINWNADVNYNQFGW